MIMEINNKVRRTCRSILLLGMLLLSTMSFAQTTRTVYCMGETVMDILFRGSTPIAANAVYVNEQVTTHIVMPENIKLVDISTDGIIGNQCADNIVRIKPAGRMYDHELAGTVTVIGERHIAQFNVVYVKGPAKANSIYNIDLREAKPYKNPDVSMPEGTMAKYAWTISTMPAHFHNINNCIDFSHKRTFG